MVKSTAKSSSEYIDSLPSEKRSAIEAVRKIILVNLPPGFEETMQYGMISYVIPLSRYPDTYNGQALAIISLGAQKNYNVLHLMALYMDQRLKTWFDAEWKKSGKKLDMGKACIRFKTAEDLALEVVGKVVANFSVDDLIAIVEKFHTKK